MRISTAIIIVGLLAFLAYAIPEVRAKRGMQTGEATIGKAIKGGSYGK